MASLAQGHEKVTLGLLTLLPVILFYSLKFQILIFSFFIILIVLSGHLYFFRDPNRKIDINSDLILAPADGKIYQIDRDQGIIRIRMNILNVHVTRIPVSGNINNIEFKKGKNWPFFLLFSRGTTENSRQIILIENSVGKFVVTQIVGILARKCVCYFEENNKIQQGDRLGMIYYGSEADIQFPLDKFDILVNEKDKSIAGITPLARLKEHKGII